MTSIDLKGPMRGSGWRSGSRSSERTVYIVEIGATMKKMGTATQMMVAVIVSVSGMKRKEKKSEVTDIYILRAIQR